MFQENRICRSAPFAPQRSRNSFLITLVDESKPKITHPDELNEGLNGSPLKTRLGIDFLFLSANSRGSNKGPLKSAILHSRKRPFSFLSFFFFPYLDHKSSPAV